MATSEEQPAHILVVEDDASLSSWIADYLNDNGLSVSIASRGDDALTLIADDQPDLVILDINLPVVNGFDVCRQAREFYSRPILMLTARGDEPDEVQGLESGANDYLVKPVRPRALLARINSLLRRNESIIDDQRIEFGSLLLHATSRSVQLDGEIINVSSNEFDLLWLLAQHAGQVMSRDQMVEHLRGIEYDGFNRSVDILVSRLRKKLRDDTTSPARIKTVWGKGYLFAADAW
jgi:two-component system OmpR family response regulator/two-component system response regulator RstA